MLFCYSVFKNSYSVFSTMQRYEVWKYPPNNLAYSENIPIFAPEVLQIFYFVLPKRIQTENYSFERYEYLRRNRLAAAAHPAKER